MFSIKMQNLQAGSQSSSHEPSLELWVPSSPGLVDFLVQRKGERKARERQEALVMT